MSNSSALHAPSPIGSRRNRSAFDLAALIAVVVAVALAAHLAGSKPRAGASSPTAVAQEARR